MQQAATHQRSLARALFCACQATQQRSRTQPCTGSLSQQRSLARAPCFACQARQQRSRTQSCTGSLFCLPGKAETQQAATQQNAVLHGLFVLLARGGSNTNGKHHGHPARRSSSTTVRYGANPGRLGGTPCWGIVHWESTPTSMFGHHRDTHVCMERCIPAHASVACRRRCTARTHGPHPHATCRVRRALRGTLTVSLVPNDAKAKKNDPTFRGTFTLLEMKFCQMDR